MYYAYEDIDRRNHNGDNINTTDLNAAQIATLKNHHAKDLNIDHRITKF